MGCVQAKSVPLNEYTENGSHVSKDEDLQYEFKNCNPKKIAFHFEDIIDDKHIKYMKSYVASDEAPTLFWGIGIENETYLMLSSLCSSTEFRKLVPKRERYSVNYFNNFKPAPFSDALEHLRSLDSLTYPVYINSHTFKSTDLYLQHQTRYDEYGTPNLAFTESIHDILLRENSYYQTVYDKSFVFDGDSIEFITQNFYNTTVNQCIEELIQIKQDFQREVFPFFAKHKIGSVQFPDHNYGLVTMLSTFKRNLLVCNNGTHHINITLPTLLQHGTIIDKDTFAKQHLTYIQCIQMVEPLMVACYGTPDVLSIIDSSYSLGSLRVSLSRYISLQTYNTASPINGKLLLMTVPEDSTYWYNQLRNSPYRINQSIGYDINFNKFKNHGVELRFFEWFPESYLIDVTNFFILLAQHSLTRDTFSFDKTKYNTILHGCVRKGFTYYMTPTECDQILQDLHLPCINQSITAHGLLCHINDVLYERYRDGSIVQLMSPKMNRPQIVNYNQMAFQRLHQDLYGKPELIIRAESHPLETRTPIVPSDIPSLHAHYTVLVESSTSRCYSDDTYRAQGAIIVPPRYWVQAKHSYVLGLKEIQDVADSTQTLLHFAHCFKGQEGWKSTLDKLRPCTFIDYEYMVDSQQKRRISFCGQSGKIGTYLALVAFRQAAMPPFHEDMYRMMIEKMDNKPRVLLIGFGSVGKASKAVLDQFDIPYTIVRSKDCITKELIFSHHILINAIRLSDDISVTPAPFLVTEDLPQTGMLSVICDISCDLGNPRNVLPIYSEYTSMMEPVRKLSNTLSLIAIPHLPSLEPDVSSDRFSSILTRHLPYLLHFKKAAALYPEAAAFYTSYQKFQSLL